MHDILLPPNRAIRLRNSYRYPEEAALAARLPLLGRRVPARQYWRQRPLHMFELPREMAASAFLPFARRFRRAPDSRARRMRRRVRAAGAVATETIIRPVVEGASRIERLPLRRPDLHMPGDVRLPSIDVPRAPSIKAPSLPSVEFSRPRRDDALRRRRLSSGALLTGAFVGLLAMFYFDPASGRRRRALVRDKFARVRHIFTRDVPRRIEKRARFFGGVARGVGHETAGLVLHDGHHVDVDDETLVARVRSEALRNSNVKSGEVNVEAYQGAVTLRGQIEHPGDIRRLIEATRRVDGVREVRSYLHLPGTLPANKAEVYQRETTTGV